MKNKFMKTGMALLLTTAGMTVQAQSLQPQVDFNAVNNVIEEVITSSVKLDTVIKGVSLVFDPASNLQQGKLDAKFAAVAGVTPWEKNQNSQMSLQLGSRFKQVNDLTKEGALKLKVQAKTPVLEMIRYFAGKETENPTTSPTPDPFATIIKKLVGVKDLTELYQIALEFKQLLIANADTQEIKDFAENLSFTVKTVDGKVEYFKIEETKPISLNIADLEMRKMALTIKTNSISAGFTLAATMSTEVFDSYVKESTTFLAELQGRNQEFLGFIKDSVSAYIELVREFLTRP